VRQSGAKAIGIDFMVFDSFHDSPGLGGELPCIADFSGFAP